MIDGYERARKAIEHVLGALNVITVVCIDDIYGLDDAEESAPVAVAWTNDALSGGKQAECAEAWTPLLHDMPSFNGPAEVWKRQLRSAWEELSPHQRAVALQSLGGILDRGGDLQGDQAAASLLPRLMPPTVQLRELGPADWEQHRSALFGELRHGERLLCLFDHNLEAAEGYGASQGVQLMDGAIEARGELPVICGLLTHTVPEGEEIAKATELAREIDRPRKDVVVLSKDRLSNPVSFAHGLKMMVLNHTRDELTTLVEGFSREATEQAKVDLLDLDIYDFDHMVLRSSQDEGVWEAETLLRIFDVFRHRAFRQQTLLSAAGQALADAISEVRKVRAIPTVADPEVYPRRERWDIRRLELYEDADVVNAAHLPLQLGDLFEVGGRKLVLVAQPCDLMIRQDGNRSADMITLLGITGNRSESSFPLDHCDVQTGKTQYVKFRSRYYVSAEVLDLSVFDPSGRCRLDTTGSAPSSLHPPWVKRFHKIRQEFGRHAQRLDELTYFGLGANLGESCPRYLRECLVSRITASTLNISCQYVGGVLEFDARRTGRYREPGATALLSTYASFLARHAEPHDYTPPEMLSDGVRKCQSGHAFPEAPYVAAHHSRKFHKTACRHAGRLLAGPHLCIESREAAIDLRLDPCILCARSPDEGA